MEKQKYRQLKKLLLEMGHVVVAYSGGVDSTYLLKVAYDVLGDRAFGVLAVSPSFPSREYEHTMDIANRMGVRIEVIKTKELDDEKFRNNPIDRCYFCKSELFDKIAELAGSVGYENMVDGTNFSDNNDHRPGMRALHERGVRSPLREAKITKKDIRLHSRELGLPTWKKDELACLSSRFPYGEEITLEKLAMVDEMENYLRDLGFRNIRARHEKRTVKIELEPAQISLFMKPEIRMKVLTKGKKVGYKYVTLDLEGYRRGSLNEVIEQKEKTAVILAHYYQKPEIQDIADFVGDSLDLSRKSANTDADIIVFAGVNFMAETAKILSPRKKVLLPDLNAKCSLAESCPTGEFKKFREKYPDHIVVSYVNTTAEIKALTDIACTSTNATRIIESIPENQKIIFAPDRNLGNYLKSLTNRDMVIWDGACHVHEEFSLEKILEIKKNYPDAKLIAHPECRKPVQIAADFVGSTSSLLKFTESDNSKEYIVATEPGILHQMKKRKPDKLFIPAPPLDSTCGCVDCEFMKMHDLQKIYNSLKNDVFEIEVKPEMLVKARKPILRMLELSNKKEFAFEKRAGS